MKNSTITFAGIAIIVGIILFRVKYEVVNLEHQQQEILKSINRTSESIHILKAEWAHLNDMKRIQKLSDRYLKKIQPLSKHQLIAFHDAAGGDGGYDRKALEELIDAAVAENQKRQEADIHD